MGTRSFIAHIDRRGNGLAIYCGQGSHPRDLGALLLTSYQRERDVRALTALGRVSRVLETPELTARYSNISAAGAATKFNCGTQGFFGRFWTPGTEWLYAWTADGWFAAPGLRPTLGDWYYDEDHPDHNSEMTRLHELAAGIQVPVSLHQLVEEQQRQDGPPPGPTD